LRPACESSEIGALLRAGMTGTAEPWDEERTPFKEMLVLQGETYRMEVLFDTVPMQTDVTTVTHDDPCARFSPSRSLFYLRRTSPAIEAAFPSTLTKQV